jgi:hypothetical protein
VGAGNGATTDGASGGEEERNRAAHRERYHVALQVKLLVDAPEQVRVAHDTQHTRHTTRY